MDSVLDGDDPNNKSDSLENDNDPGPLLELPNTTSPINQRRSSRSRLIVSAITAHSSVEASPDRSQSSLQSAASLLTASPLAADTTRRASLIQNLTSSHRPTSPSRLQIDPTLIYRRRLFQNAPTPADVLANTAMAEEAIKNRNPYSPSDPRRKSSLYDLEDEDVSKDSLLVGQGKTSKFKSKSRPVGMGKDLPRVILLIILYLIQGIPVGLALGSVPFLLKSMASKQLSYADLGLFSFASYPYSLKLFWSPIVDSIYVEKWGRRKSWIVPIQTILGCFFLWLGSHIDGMLVSEAINIYQMTLIFTILVFLSATQDIAVDGWALTILSKANLHYASTSQTIGLNTGYFLSFTVFLALQSPEFCNQYLRTIPSTTGLLTLGSYLTFWGAFCLVVTAIVTFLVPEEAEATPTESVVDSYKTIWRISKLPTVVRLTMVFLVCKIGFIANDSVATLKLLDKGFRKEDLALTVLIDFPFQILFGYFAAKWSTGERRLRPWMIASFVRLFFGLVGMIGVYTFPVEGVTPTYFCLVTIISVLTSFSSTVMFVSQGAFFASVADPAMGGTYMTLLNTVANFGGTWPKYFIMEGVDYFTTSECTFKNNENQVFSCSSESDKSQCASLGGQCHIVTDGYYIVTSITMLLGLLILLVYVQRAVRQLESERPESWRLTHSSRQT